MRLAVFSRCEWAWPWAWLAGVKSCLVVVGLEPLPVLGQGPVGGANALDRSINCSAVGDRSGREAADELWRRSAGMPPRRSLRASFCTQSCRNSNAEKEAAEAAKRLCSSARPPRPAFINLALHIPLLACGARAGLFLLRSLTGSRHCSSRGLQGQQQRRPPPPLPPPLGCLPSPVIIHPHHAVPTGPEAPETANESWWGGGGVSVFGAIVTVVIERLSFFHLLLQCNYRRPQTGGSVFSRWSVSSTCRLTCGSGAASSPSFFPLTSSEEESSGEALVLAMSRCCRK